MQNQPPIKNKIQQNRESKGINQQELATALGVSRCYLSKLENQKFSPSPELMAKVCRYFDMGLGNMFRI